MISLDLSAIIGLMVNNVGKLTRSVRESFLKREPAGGTQSLDEKRAVVRRELEENGRSIFVDEHGNRYLIERRPA